MVLSKPKILIASDGDKTYAVMNGVPLRCEELTFHTDGIDATISIDKAHSGHLFTGEQFLHFVENELGYKLSAE